MGDHPRSRGVYRGRECGAHNAEGSSPLARGLRRPAAWRIAWSRIIPARAGFTMSWSRRMSRYQDHPRSRGVYYRSLAIQRAYRGSSPLARGLRTPRRSAHPSLRIIPARAGFTVKWTPARYSSPDHPRSRGVYESKLPGASSTPGSSPLARGLRRVNVERPVAGRIIPARAGFTKRKRFTRFVCPDHPRSRGVYSGRSVPWRPFGGSSPLARGLRARLRRRSRSRRIIPARAGFTVPFVGDGGGRADHPRSRGVYVIIA